MTNIKYIFAFLLLLSRIIIGLFCFYHLVMNIRNPIDYPLERINWFLYFFVLELWFYNAMSKPTDSYEPDNKDEE
jgi:hypothetical protein